MIQRTSRTYRRIKISRVPKSNYRSAIPTTDQDIFFSWFQEQNHWRFRAARPSSTYRRIRISKFLSPTMDRLVPLQIRIYSPVGSRNRATGDLEN